LEDFRFHEGKLPSAYRYNFEQSLFATEDYRQLQSSAHWISFYILNERDFLVEGHIHFYLKDGVAKSIVQGPFGGVEVSDVVNDKTIFDFIDFFCSRLKELNCKTATVVDRPLAYNPARQSLIETFMLNLGFTLSNAEISSIITITSKSFSEKIHPRKKRKLNQSLAGNLEFRTLDNTSIREIYTFIETHRKEKNYVLSVSLDHLLISVERLPDAYHLFGVFYEGKVVAASVAVRVTKNILYHFISDHVRKIDDARPSLILMQGIYKYCQDNKIQLLDLGTSATDGLPNFKLINFKTELAAQPTQKLTFTKQLS
jgi:hypothetical protein